MFDTFSETNKKTQQALAIRYKVNPASSGGYYEVTRTASKRYSYVGMTEAAARRCCRCKVAQYMRDFTLIGSSGSDETVRECKTDIQEMHGDGHLWNVEISVNESDVRRADSSDVKPAALFAAENKRNYDQGGASAGLDLISIGPPPESSSATYSVVVAPVGIEITTPDAMKAYVKADEGDEWSETAIYHYVGSTYLLMLGDALTKFFIKVAWGGYESNVISYGI